MSIHSIVHCIIYIFGTVILCAGQFVIFNVLVLFSVISLAGEPEAGVDIFPDPSFYCLGTTHSWQCVVPNGTAIGWLYGPASRFYLANNSLLLPLGSSPFRTGPTVIGFSAATSMAWANISNLTYNETELQCSDGSGSEAVITINIKGKYALILIQWLLCRLLDPANLLIT